MPVSRCHGFKGGKPKLRSGKGFRLARGACRTHWVVRMIRRLMVALLLLAGTGCLCAEPVPCTVLEALEMPDAELARQEPRVLKGVLTYHEPGHRMAFLQDATGAIYLQIKDTQAAAAGDEVEALLL